MKDPRHLGLIWFGDRVALWAVRPLITAFFPNIDVPPSSQWWKSHNPDGWPRPQRPGKLWEACLSIPQLLPRTVVIP